MYRDLALFKKQLPSREKTHTHTYIYIYNIYIYIYGTPPPKKKKPTFGHFLTVFTVFCNLFGTLNFEANFEGGPYIYIYMYTFIYFFVCMCTRGVCVCVCVSDLMCSDKVLRRY